MTAITVETLKVGGWLKQNNAIGGAWRDAEDASMTSPIQPPAR
jgi:hypothetical protein